MRCVLCGMVLYDWQKVQRGQCEWCRRSDERPMVVVWTRGMRIFELMRRVILKSLELNDGNKTHAAAELGMSLRTLRHQVKKYRKAGFVVADLKLPRTIYREKGANCGEEDESKTDQELAGAGEGTLRG